MKSYYSMVVESAVEEAGQLVENLYLLIGKKPKRTVAIDCRLLVFPCLHFTAKNFFVCCDLVVDFVHD